MRTIPYFPQEDEHVCGPAVVHMTLASYEINADQKTLEEKMATRRDIGTSPSMMTNTLKEYGLTVFANEPGDLALVQQALSDDAIVIICYTEPSTDVGHYAILSEISDEQVTLVDPEPDHGPNFKLPREEFERRWRDPLFTKTDHWMAVVSAKKAA